MMNTIGLLLRLAPRVRFARGVLAMARVSATAATASMALASVFGLGVSPTAHAAEKTIYFHNDISGTPLAATDENGNVIWKETYKPYGERINNAAASNTGKGKNELYFHGKQQEALNGGVTIQYFGARYFRPDTGRFDGVDPMGFNPNSVHSFNRFAYGNNNPYKFVDPDGNSPILGILGPLATGAASGAGAAAGINIFGQMAIQGRDLSDVQWRGIGGVFESASEGALIGMFLGPAIAAEAGALRGAASSIQMKTVGRHMSPEELAAMQRTGRVQEGGGGQTRVADPASANTYKNAPKGDKYVEFDVPASRVLPHSAGTGRIPGPNSPDARAAGSSRNFEMPEATNIRVP